ncbi:hypothetical protein F8154_12755 [Alkaliphilus pronyensis]|uniref:Flavoprotein domain-containing protein n=1 Tax=Alkaliphilus pronyensis TaxID=1482732 RepID=A0A6I0F6S1_9FIRM|nr:flavoprotein [Alkaliphilus pronyensis]KAB3531654.1 hypothetical protein F8154_12755 [Alkaliphilus pronyensis]
MNRYNHTQRIIEHLMIKNINSLQSTGNKHLLVALTGTNIGLENSIKELVALKEHGFTMDIVVSNSGEKIYNVKEISRLLMPKEVYTEDLDLVKEEFIEAIDGILVPLATQNTAFKLASGIQDQLIPRLLWQALWQEKPIWMNLKDLMQYKGKKTNNLFLQEKIREVIKQLEGMGVKEFKTPLIAEALLSEVEDRTSNIKSLKKVEKIDLGKEDVKLDKGRRVITEKDVLAANTSNGEMIIPLGSIVTPLATDTAKAIGVKIIKK